MKLEDTVTLIIGAASGIGRATAEICGREGGRVVVSDIDDAGSAAVVDAITERGGDAVAIHCDITDAASVEAVVSSTVEHYGKLDGLVTSAGGESPTPGTAWDRGIDMFLKGPFYACKYALEQMERGGGGSIVNVASVAGVTGSISPTVDATAYPCAKHGVIGLTRTLALAYAAKGIRVNAVCPGYVKTALTSFLYDSDDGGQSFINDHLRIPMGRWGEPEEIGEAVAFLLSRESSFITGQPLIVDGGFMAR